MMRKVTPDEIKRFFETANTQFEQSGLFLKSVQFVRDSDGVLASIKLFFADSGNNIPFNEMNPKSG